MEIYRETICDGPVCVDVSIRGRISAEGRCWIHCTGRSSSGDRVLWQTYLVDDAGHLKTYDNVEAAMEEMRTILSQDLNITLSRNNRRES